MFDAASDRPQETRVRLVAWLGLILSIGVLIGSYIAISAYSSTAWLWPVIVHESGDRTLAQTVLYYEHAARELALDVLLGVAVAGGVLYALPGAVGKGRGPASRAAGFAAGLIGTVALILGGTLRAGGLPVLWENLLQYPTRPGEPLVWGGHWRYHLLSHVTLMSMSFGLAAVLRLVTGHRTGGRAGLSTFLWGAGSFLGLAIVFLPGSDSFSDPVFLGHQAREVATHGAVTVPLAWSVCLLLGRDAWADRSRGDVGLISPVLAVCVGVAAGLYLLWGSLASTAASQGQSESLVVLIFPHFFEHTFSYLVTTLTAGLTFEWVRRA